MLNFKKQNIMKKTFRTIAIIAIFVISPVFSIHGFSQADPPLPGGSPVGGPGGPVGGSAPVDGGLSILLVLSAAYGFKKTYYVKKGK